MSITKLGANFISGIGNSLRNVKTNLIPALKTVATQTPGALMDAGRVLNFKSYGGLKQSVRNASSIPGRVLARKMGPDQMRALSTGAKSLAAIGAVGYGLSSGNKDYNNTMQDINKWQQYKMVDDNNNPVQG